MTVIYAAQNAALEKKPRSTLLPLLVVLFVISYAILTLLVVEQGRTIEVQRGLLREMLKDSTQLSELKGKIAREAAAARAHEKPAPRIERQDPAGGATANSGNDSKAVPQTPGKEEKQPGKSRTMKDVPEAPASDLQDVRRSTREI